MRRRYSGTGCGARGRRQTQPSRSGGPGQPSARTMTGCLQWLDARDTKGGGSRLDGEARKAFPMRPRKHAIYGDRKAAGGAPRGAAHSKRMRARSNTVAPLGAHTLDCSRGKREGGLPGASNNTGDDARLLHFTLRGGWRKRLACFTSPPSPTSFTRMLPDAKDFDTLTRQFRWNIPARYNIGVDACDRWAERRSRSPRHFAHAAPTAAKTASPTAPCARRRTGSPMCCARTVSRAATASRSCCRRRRRSRPRHIAIYKIGAIALPLAILFGVDALSYRLQNSGAKARHHQRAGSREAHRHPRTSCPTSRSCSSVDGARPMARCGFHETVARARRPASRRS